MDIQSRKKDHVESATKKHVEYCPASGFEDIRFVHNSLPEIDLDSVDTSCRLFGKSLSSPLIITGMTGGYSGAEKINQKLAIAAQKNNIAFGLGSQRAMLEKPKLSSTFKVRKVAPDIPIIGNIGACQLEKYGVRKIREMLDAVEADVLAIHLNPLQEVLQPEGDNKFSGIVRHISIFAKELGLPVIVKETGAGMSRDAAIKVKKAGAAMADVSGAGGTSWSKVEYLRSKKKPVFSEWGNPTCECIASCSEVIETIASGGIRDGLDAAKSIALGASFAGAALPFLRAKDPSKEVEGWKNDLKIAMLLSGSKNLAEMKKAKLIITGKTAEAMQRLGIDVSRFSKR